MVHKLLRGELGTRKLRQQVDVFTAIKERSQHLLRLGREQIRERGALTCVGRLRRQGANDPGR